MRAPAAFPTSLRPNYSTGQRRERAERPPRLGMVVPRAGCFPSQAVMEFAKQMMPHLVMMASRRRYSRGRRALGSVADDVSEGPDARVTLEARPR